MGVRCALYGLRETLGDSPMSRSQNRDRMRSLLALDDLDARLAPLDRYGLVGFSFAIADGLRALMGISRNAMCGAVRSAGCCGQEC